MSRTGWKAIEREAADLVGGKRHWANAGEREDVDSVYFACQVKNPKRLALAELERLVDEMTLRGIDGGKMPVVIVKRSARAATQMLVAMPAQAFRILLSLAAIRELSDADLASLRRELCEMKQYPGMRKRVAEFVEKSKAKNGPKYRKKEQP